VVIVIKDKEQTALERFIFSIETMIEVEGYNKDTEYSPLFDDGSVKVLLNLTL